MTLRGLFVRFFSVIRNKRMELDSYVWIDLEMTGLEVESDKILEAACIITKPDLNPVHKGIVLVIHQPEEVLQSMNEWSMVQHGKSGLTYASRHSKFNISEADQQLADYIKLHTDSGGVRYLAGNSVYMDKRFLEKYMPFSDSLLSNHIIDVSSLKVLCSHWFPDDYSKMPPKKKLHRALDDIAESLAELQKFQKIMFKD